MTLPMVMCRGCGHFQTAEVVDGGREPVQDACERCGGASFTTVDEE